MSYDRDPARWTTSPEEAPELLRGAFSAGRDEGPNRAQMRSLALKIAAASAGGAIAVGTVKAASAGQAAATAASWSLGKIASVVALAGSLVTGALVWQSGSHEPAPKAAPLGARGAEQAAASAATAETRALKTSAAPQLAPQQIAGESAPRVESLAPDGAASARRERVGDVTATRRGQAKAPAAPLGVAPSRSQAGAKAGRVGRPAASTARTGAQPKESADAPAARRAQNEEATRPLSEIELLRRAQVALQSRPREAFQLTQEHRRVYPAGEFAQERDALAVQALMHAGESEKARELAEAFIRKHPSSPHAHRFREALGIR